MIKKILWFLLIYIALDVLVYYDRDNNYIGKWDVVRVIPKAGVYPAEELSMILKYSKYEGVKSSFYLQNSKFEMYFDDRRVFSVPIKYTKIHQQLCFGAIEPDKCIYRIKDGEAMLSLPAANVIVKRDFYYYLSPGFVFSWL